MLRDQFLEIVLGNECLLLFARPRLAPRFGLLDTMVTRRCQPPRGESIRNVTFTLYDVTQSCHSTVKFTTLVSWRISRSRRIP